jgi:transposase
MTYSTDILWRVVYSWYFYALRPEEISRSLFVSLSKVYRVIRRFRENQPIIIINRPANRRQRRDKRLQINDLRVLTGLVESEAAIYLDELADALQGATGTVVSLPMLCRALRHQLKITRKMLHKRSAEACGIKRADFAAAAAAAAAGGLRVKPGHGQHES